MLDTAVAEMQLYYEDRVKELYASHHYSQLCSDIVVLDHNSFTTVDFCRLWRCGTPIVVQNVHTGLQGRWTPADFIRDYGSRSVELIDCATGDTRRWSVADFFSRMTAPELGLSVMKLKVGIVFFAFLDAERRSNLPGLATTEALS